MLGVPMLAVPTLATVKSVEINDCTALILATIPP